MPFCQPLTLDPDVTPGCHYKTIPGCVPDRLTPCEDAQEEAIVLQGGNQTIAECCAGVIVNDHGLAESTTVFMPPMESDSVCRVCYELVMYVDGASENTTSALFASDNVGFPITLNDADVGVLYCGAPGASLELSVLKSDLDQVPQFELRTRCKCTPLIGTTEPIISTTDFTSPTITLQPAPTPTPVTAPPPTPEPTPAPTPEPTPPDGKKRFADETCEAVCMTDVVMNAGCDERGEALIRLSFDELAAGLQDGELSDAMAAYGVRVAINSPKEVYMPPMLFDSAVPSGNAFQLGAPNEACGGEGWGHGGRPGRDGENCKPLDKCMIISSDCDSDDPTPSDKGGHAIFEFCSPAYVHSLTLLNAARGTTIEFFDEFGNSCGDEYRVPYQGANAKHVANDRNGNLMVDDEDVLAVQGGSLYGVHEYPPADDAWANAHCQGEPVSRVVVHMNGATCLDDLQFSVPALGKTQCLSQCGMENCCIEQPVPCGSFYNDCIAENSRDDGQGEVLLQTNLFCEAQLEKALSWCEAKNEPVCCKRNSREMNSMAEMVGELECELCGRNPTGMFPSECRPMTKLGACCMGETGDCVDGLTADECEGTHFARHYCRDRAVDQCRRGQCCDLEPPAPTPAPTPAPLPPGCQPTGCGDGTSIEGTTVTSSAQQDGRTIRFTFTSDEECNAHDVSHFVIPVPASHNVAGYSATDCNSQPVDLESGSNPMCAGFDETVGGGENVMLLKIGTAPGCDFIDVSYNGFVIISSGAPSPIGLKSGGGHNLVCETCSVDDMFLPFDFFPARKRWVAPAPSPAPPSLCEPDTVRKACEDNSRFSVFTPYPEGTEPGTCLPDQPCRLECVEGCGVSARVVDLPNGDRVIEYFVAGGQECAEQLHGLVFQSVNEIDLIAEEDNFWGAQHEKCSVCADDLSCGYLAEYDGSRFELPFEDDDSSDAELLTAS
ncbi:MAG TPA: hypothetical protein VLD39_02325, partial [Gammaproteobacteria bacterium]|nr:hypothetical protein [Gammaproteobacteria bacterium]